MTKNISSPRTDIAINSQADSRNVSFFDQTVHNVHAASPGELTAEKNSSAENDIPPALHNLVQNNGIWKNLRAQVPDNFLKTLANHTIPLATEATKYLDQKLDFFMKIPASEKSEIQFIIQIAISQFVEWAHAQHHAKTITLQYANPKSTLTNLLSMEETVEITRHVLEFFEEGSTYMANSPEQAAILRELVLRYGWEIGFATATAYARVAESRGSLDSRLEASLVDSIIRNEEHNILFSQAAALSINTQEQVTCVAFYNPSSTFNAMDKAIIDTAEQAIIINQLALKHKMHILCGLHGNYIILLIFGKWDKSVYLRDIIHVFPDICIVISNTVPELIHTSVAAKTTLSALDALPAWPDAPRPVYTDDLLPERALSGEKTARKEMITRFVQPVIDAGPAYLETIERFLINSSVELTAADLFVHQNTIRYRLKKIAELNGLDVFNSRDIFTLRMAFSLWRLH